MNRLTLQAGGEIFNKRAQKKALQVSSPVQYTNKKTASWRKTTGVVSFMLVMVVAINVFVAAWNQPTATTKEQQANPAATPEFYSLVNRGQSGTNPTQTANHNHQGDESVTPRVPEPINTGPGPIIPPPVVNVPPIVNVPNGGTPDVGGAISQINSINSQIVQQMNACIQLNAQARNQVAQLRAQQQQLDVAIQEYNRAINAVNPQDPNASAIRFQLRQQRDTAVFQRNQINNAITATRSQFNNARSNCQNTVSRMQTAKRNAESALNTSFQRAMSVNF